MGVIFRRRRDGRGGSDIDIEASYFDGNRMLRCGLRIDDAGVGMSFGKNKRGGYSWDEIRRISFDDPGRTKASGAAIAMFGVLGMASRRAFTLITVSTSTEELYFENDAPVGQWRATGRRIVEDVPAAAGRVYVDGNLADAVSAAPANDWHAGWYPDPLGLPSLRWHDGTTWTEHTAPAPGTPD